MSKKSNISIDLSGVNKRFGAQALRKKQAVFAHRVGSDMNKHCPVDEGTLRDSMPISSDFDRGQVIWNTPYAQEVLNAKSVRNVKSKSAKPNWPEYTKKERLEDWEKMAAELMGGDTSVTFGGV